MSLKRISRREFWGVGFQIRFISNVSQMHFTLKFGHIWIWSVNVLSCRSFIRYWGCHIFTSKRTLISDSEVKLCRYQTHSLSPQKCSSCWIWIFTQGDTYIFVQMKKKQCDTAHFSPLHNWPNTVCSVGLVYTADLTWEQLGFTKRQVVVFTSWSIVSLCFSCRFLNVSHTGLVVVRFFCCCFFWACCVFLCLLYVCF